MQTPWGFDPGYGRELECDMKMEFSKMGLSPKTLHALGSLRYMEATEVQEKVIPFSLLLDTNLQRQIFDFHNHQYLAKAPRLK